MALLAFYRGNGSFPEYTFITNKCSKEATVLKKVIPKQCPSKKNCFEKTHTLYKFLKNHSGKLRYSKTFGILHFWHYLGVNKELKEKRRYGSILMNP